VILSKNIEVVELEEEVDRTFTHPLSSFDVLSFAYGLDWIQTGHYIIFFAWIYHITKG